MKKLVSLALAGICALAFATVADAATGVKLKAPIIKQGVSKTVGTAKIQVNQVKTEYSQYAQDYARDNGGYFNVYSVWSDNILNSQTVYDDVKQALNKVGSQFSNIFPAIAQEATYVHAAQISSGSAKYNMRTQNAGSGYASVYNIAHYVIPGRVAALAQGTTEIDMSTENAPNGGVQGNSNGGRTFESEEAAEKWVAAVRTAFNNIESENAQNVANKVSSLSNIYNKFLADQAKVLAAAQKVYDDAVAARQAAQRAYNNAIATREAKQADYDAKSDLSKVEAAYNKAISDRQSAKTALDNAKSAEAQAKAEKEAKEAIVASAQADYNAAVEAFDAFDYDAEVANLEAVRQAAIAQAEADRQAEYDSALAAKDLAEDAYFAAKETIKKVEVIDGEEVVVEEIEPDPEVVEAAYNAYQQAKGALHTATINLRTPVDTTSFDNAYNGGVGALDAQVRALRGSLSNTKANLDAANAEKDVAVKAYNAKVQAREAKEVAFADAKTVEANAKTAKDNAVQAKADAKTALDNAKTAEANAKTALANANSDESNALAVLNALKVKQANDNAAKLAELKSQLTSYINGLKYVDDQTGDYGLKYNVNMIDGYDNLRFDQVVYQANSFTEPEYSLSSANKKDDKAVESIVSVSYRQQPYTMVDGVLQQVSYVDTDKYETSIYFQNGTKRISPLVLDITGNGVLQASNGQNMPGHDVVKENNIISDFFGDGFEIAMEWVGPQDGLLVAPKADGSVDMSCLFGTAGGYETGYEKLSLYDKNNDMKVTGEELNDLAIWQDANGNGIADAGEVKSVKSLGITSINVEFNKENFVSSFERNGQTYKMWDWWPNAVELVKLAAK